MRRLLLAREPARVDQGIALAAALGAPALDALLRESAVRGGRLVAGKPFAGVGAHQPLRERALRGLIARHPNPRWRRSLRHLEVHGAGRSGAAPLAAEALGRFEAARTLALLRLAGLPRSFPPALRRLRVYDVGGEDLLPRIGEALAGTLWRLDLEQLPVLDLAGVEQLRALRVLGLRGLRRLVRVDALAGHPALRVLSLRRLGLGPEPLPPLPALRVLKLEGGPAHIALRPEALPRLQRFAARDPGDATLAGLFALPTVEHVRIEGALRRLRLAGIGPGARLRRLELLHCAQVDLRGVAEAPALAELTVRGSVAVDLAPVAGAPALRRLALAA
ncbi:MAG: hypothetical protein AAF447_05140, partial [Myxococcota bacterium]